MAGGGDFFKVYDHVESPGEIAEWRSEIGGNEREVLTILNVREHTIHDVANLLPDEDMFELPETSAPEIPGPRSTLSRTTC